MKPVVSLIFLFLAISVANTQIASDISTTLQKINKFVCTDPGVDKIPEKTFHKFVHCADLSIPSLINVCDIGTE